VSIKDDMNFVKTELSGDEKILESAFKLETFYKKYKLPIIGTVGAILLYVVVSMGMEAVEKSRLEASERFCSMLLSAWGWKRSKNPDLKRPIRRF